ncbi:Cu2+-exporting ATPase [Ketogulonicigenium robustum]|uniref:P-type Cu(2+) transporter n=1 Tax=Ketogulonicigenium robustum TaxID=92947 RepID=A0A1W6NXZ8_9RHOB|nr:heavy metal translocating P-type ATPase [Ketogulonicigenium robustum]ARO14112.1 Cu2+-exporting ATPase [Ketogulonicigenium robustum]
MELSFDIQGMTCASCAARAQKVLSKVDGVAQADVNLATHVGRVSLAAGATAAEVTQNVAAALDKAGYPAQAQHRVLEIEGMTCASCVARVEKALAAVPGVSNAHVNLATRTAQLDDLSRDADRLVAAVTRAGYDARLRQDEAAREDRDAAEAAVLQRNLLVAAALTAPVFVLEMGSHLIPGLGHALHGAFGALPLTLWLFEFLLITAVLAWPGQVFFRRGIPALLHSAPDMNALVAVGAGAAWLYSSFVLFLPGLVPDAGRVVYFEAAGVIVTLILAGRWLEARARGRAGAAIRRLMDLRPATAWVEREGGPVEVPVAALQVGDVLQLRPGARIATDARVLSGQSYVDESMITGEPMPATKAEGDALVGGTLNGVGMMRAEVTAVGGETVLARILTMVEEAQGARLPVQDLVNRITLWFVPVVMALAALTVAVWLVFGPDPRLSHALVAGVSVLIIACPCAMGLAVPVSIIVGAGRAAELGVLFRKGDALQRLSDVTTFAFDKTGTLTEGKPRLQTFESRVDGDLLAEVAAVEALSEHPTAQAIVAGAAGRALPLAQDVVAVPGMGVTGAVGGHRLAIGNQRLMAREQIDLAPVSAQLAALAVDGQAPVLIARDGQIAGWLTVADQVKPDASQTVAALRASGARVVMISGDAKANAQRIAAQLGVDEVLAEVLPEGKRDAILALQASGPVAFTGDGINDAAALATANVGLAVGNGTDIAIESADVVLMSGDIAGVLRARQVARATMVNIRQNLFWAFAYNVLLIPVAAGVLYPAFGWMLSPALAAGAMALSSVVVVGNALRLRRAGGSAGGGVGSLADRDAKLPAI